MQEGWISLHRSLLDHEIWTKEPFTKGQAWVDLLLLTNHKPGWFFVRGVRVDVQRGQCGWSEERLSLRWKWSRTKVRNFLNLLQNEGQIVQQKNNVSLLITITNYDRYQNKEQQKEQQKNSRKTAEEQQKDTNNNDNNENNENKNTLKPKRAPLPGEDFIQALRTSPAYQGVDIDKELAKMDIWLMGPKGKGRKKTHRFITNWLNKAERILPPESPPEEACTRCGTTKWTSLKNLDKEKICDGCIKQAKQERVAVRNGSGAVQPGGDTP